MCIPWIRSYSALDAVRFNSHSFPPLLVSTVLWIDDFWLPLFHVLRRSNMRHNTPGEDVQTIRRLSLQQFRNARKPKCVVTARLRTSGKRTRSHLLAREGGKAGGREKESGLSILSKAEFVRGHISSIHVAIPGPLSWSCYTPPDQNKTLLKLPPKAPPTTALPHVLPIPYKKEGTNKKGSLEYLRFTF